jgi:hypothetical protein
MTRSESVPFRETVCAAARQWSLDDKGVEYLLAAAKNDGPAPVRAAAIESVAALRLDVDVVLAAIADPHRVVRLAAARAAARLDAAEAVPRIIAALESEGLLRVPLNDALVTLTGVDKRGDFAAWKAWWNREGEAALASRPPREEREEALDRAWNPPATHAEFYGLEIVSKRVLFVLDVSGSMKGKKLVDARDQLRYALQALPVDAKFGLLRFNIRPERWSNQLADATPANRSAALSWMEDVEPEEGTNILNALSDALLVAGVNQRRLAADTIYLVTDGRQSLGKPESVMKRIRERNPWGKVIIHVIAIGDDADVDFLRALAEENGGTFVRR